jgi:beta-barrel assembly-enhancing protease
MTGWRGRRSITSVLIIALVGFSSPAGPGVPKRSGEPLASLLNRSYLEILDLSEQVSYPKAEFETVRQQLGREEEAEKKRLEAEQKGYETLIKSVRRELDALNRKGSRDNEATSKQRQSLHCRILKLENKARQSEIARKQGVPVAFDNRRAKLALLQQWRVERQRIEASLRAGTARSRRYGNVEDIGVRSIAEGQEKDIKMGQDAIREMMAYGLMPPTWEDPALNKYVREVADNIAVHSDLKIPLKVTVLDSEEVNAFALPGGYLYLNTGLIAKTGTESELVGVMAHELAHVTARHSAKLMKRATIAGIIYQAAQVVAMIMTGGVVGIGTYYALQYGFFGLGLVLDLALLGVSREYEDEADQLGVQYAWKSGYDPRGFITLFDKLAMEKGYVSTASFFRTHPPYAERIFSTFRELSYLPEGPALQVDSRQFQEMKKEMLRKQKELHQESGKRPSLKRYPDCPEDEGDPLQEYHR